MRTELARLVDAFLAGSEPPPPDRERVELMRAWVRGEPPLLELRKSRGLKREELVSRLTKLLGLKPDLERKVGRYYHELEAGLLGRAASIGASGTRLQTLLGTDVRSLARWRPPPPARPSAVMYRLHDMAAPAAAFSRKFSRVEEEDEVDRLFRSGR